MNLYAAEAAQAREIPWDVPATVVATFDDTRAVTAADMDGDGDLDVIGSGSVSATDIVVWENRDGDGLFWDPQVVAPNFANDDPDLATAAFAADEVHWHENRGGQFALVTTAFSRSTP